MRLAAGGRRRTAAEGVRGGEGAGDGDQGTCVAGPAVRARARGPRRTSPPDASVFPRPSAPQFDVLTRIYPCGECAAHFSTLVRRLPPDVSSGESLRQSLCRMHNEVNARLHKPVFNCRFVDARWRALPCAEDEAAEHGGGCALLS